MLPGLLPAAALRGVRRAVDAALRRPLAPGCERPHNTLVPLRWHDAAVEAVVGSPARRDAIARAVGANDLRLVSAYVSVKPPRSGALWWHQDWWCWDHPVSFRRAASQVAVLCYLGDTSPSSGALRVLPGSHRRSDALHAVLPTAHTEHADGVPAGHPAVSDHPRQATLALRAGDAVALDYRLLHGTHPNLGGDRRDSLLLSFAPSWRRLPDDVRAHLIRHPALPTADERRALSEAARRMLPSYRGMPRDLPLNRVAPAVFSTT